MPHGPSRSPTLGEEGVKSPKPLKESIAPCHGLEQMCAPQSKVKAEMLSKATPLAERHPAQSHVEIFWARHRTFLSLATEPDTLGATRVDKASA